MVDQEKIPDEIPYVVFYSLEDDDLKLRNLGKAIKFTYGRDFIRYSADKPLNLMEIAKKITNTENPRLSNPSGWIHKLDKAGLLRQNKKLQRKKGHLLNYYQTPQAIIIVKNKELKKLLTNDENFEKYLQKILKIETTNQNL